MFSADSAGHHMKMLVHIISHLPGSVYGNLTKLGRAVMSDVQNFRQVKASSNPYGKEKGKEKKVKPSMKLTTFTT